MGHFDTQQSQFDESQSWCDVQSRAIKAEQGALVKAAVSLSWAVGGTEKREHGGAAPCFPNEQYSVKSDSNLGRLPNNLPSVLSLIK